MDLYQLTKFGLEPVEKSSFDLEKDIQMLVEANLGELFELQFVSSEFTVGEFRIDTLGFDEDASLRYTGIDSHEGLSRYGLFNTVVAIEKSGTKSK